MQEVGRNPVMWPTAMSLSAEMSTLSPHLHLDLIGEDAVVQVAHVVLRQVRAVVDAPVVLQEAL